MDEVQRLVSEIVVIDSGSGPVEVLTKAYNDMVASVARGVPIQDAASTASEALAASLYIEGDAAAKFGLSAQAFVGALETMGVVTSDQIEKFNELLIVMSSVRAEQDLAAEAARTQAAALSGGDAAYDEFEQRARAAMSAETSTGAATGYATQTMRDQSAALGELDAFYADFETRVRGVAAAQQLMVQTGMEVVGTEDAEAFAAATFAAADQALINSFDERLAAVTAINEADAALLATLSPEQSILAGLTTGEAEYTASLNNTFRALELVTNQRTAMLALMSPEEAVLSGLVTSEEAETMALNGVFAALAKVNAAQAQMAALLTTRQAEMAGLVSGETNVMAGLEEWRRSEGLLTGATASQTDATIANTAANASNAVVKGEIIGEDLKLSGAETARFTAMGIDTAGLTANTRALAGNAAATDAAAAAYARMHVGQVSIGERLGPLAVGILGVGAALAYVTIETDKWQTQLNELQNNTSITDADLQHMASGIIDVSKNTGTALDDLAAGSRHILDYSFSANDAVTILDASAKAAISTGAKTESVAQGVAQALHQYATGADEANTYVNILLRSSQLANTTLQQFSDETKTAIGFSAAIGNSYADTTAALSALTRTYGSASKASAGLDDILRYMLKPTTNEAAAWDDLSHRAGDATISSKNLAQTLGDQGLNGVINRVSAAYQKLGLSQTQAATETLNLLSGQRGGIALYDLLTKGLGDYNYALSQNKDIISGKLDPTTAAFNHTLDTAQNAWDRLGAKIHAATVEGTGFADVSRTVADSLSHSIDGWAKADGRILDFTHDWDNFIETFQRLNQASGSGDWQTFFDDLSKTYDELHNVTGATDTLKHSQDELSSELSDFSQGYVGVASAVDKYGESAITAAQNTGQIKEQFDSAAGAVRDFGDGVNQALDELGQKAPKTMAEVGQALKLAWSGKLNETIAQTQQDMGLVDQAIKKDQELGEAAAADGVAVKDNIYIPLVASLEETRTTMQNQLNVMNSLIDPAGTAGYDVGKAFADGMREGLANTGRGSQDKREHGILGQANQIAPVQLATADLSSITQKEVDANRTKLEEQGLIPGEPRRFPKEKSGRSAAAAGREANTDARQAQTAENSLTTALQKYELGKEELTLKKNLADATDVLTNATNKLTGGDKEYNSALQMLSDQEERNAVKKRDDPKLAGAKQVANVTQTMASSVAAADAAAANDLTIKIHDVTDQLKELDREAAQNMAPLKDNLDRDTQSMQALQDHLKLDTEAMTALERETAKADLAFTRQKETIQELQYQESQQEQQIMGPLTDAYNASAAAVQAAQDHVQAISDAYDKKLIPLTDKLTKLEQEKANIQREDTLGQEAASASNLAARLKDLIPGSSQYNEVLRQQAEAQRNLGLDTQIDKLTKQKNVIENQKTTALEAANLQLKAAQEQEKASKIAMDAQQKLFDAQKKNLDEQAANVDHEQKLYDEQQRDKKVAEQDQLNADQDAITAQQKLLDADNAAITSAQKVADARAKADKDYLAQLNDEQGEESYNAGQHSYNWGLAVAAANDAVTKLQAPYDTEDARLRTLAQDVRDEKTAFDEVNQPIVDSLTDQKNAAETLLDTFETRKDAIQLASSWADAQAKYAIAMAGVNDQAPPASAAIGDLAANEGVAATNTDSLNKSLGDPSTGLNANLAAIGTTLSTQVGPAVTGLSTTLDPALEGMRETWMKYFGLSGDPGYNATTSLGWYMDHKNTLGFWGHLAESTTLALSKDGWRGQWDNNFAIITTDVEGLAVTMGDGIMAGIASGTSTDPAIKKLSDAITAAVEAAMKQAEGNLGINSPSLVAAKRLGDPIAEGVAYGIDRSAFLVANSVDSMTGNAIGFSNRRGFGSSTTAMGGNVTIVNMDGMHTHLHFPNISKPPENPNEYTEQAADAIIEATHRRIKMRGLGREIF